MTIWRTYFAGQQLSGSKGMFIFDLNTEAKFQAMGSETIAEVRDEGASSGKMNLT